MTIPEPDLDRLAADMADLLNAQLRIDVTGSDVRPHLAGFLAAVLGTADGEDQ